MTYSLLLLLVSVVAACGTPALGLEDAEAREPSSSARNAAERSDLADASPERVSVVSLDASRPTDASVPPVIDAPESDLDPAPSVGGPKREHVSKTFRLALLQRYGVPVSNATGVACDGSSVWLIGGGHNALRHELVHADLATSEIDERYSYDNLIESAGTGVYGITRLDGAIYISVAGNTNKLVVVDEASGAVQKQMQAPTILGPSDLDVSDARQLILSSGTGDVFTLDAKTGAVRAQFAAGSSGRNHGVATRGDEAFVGSLFGGMDVFDVVDGALIGHVAKLDGSELEQDKDIGSMCFRGEHLLVLSSLGLSEYEVRETAQP
jgi:hypothetical protein